jgi:hypothetical protein
VEDPRRQGGGEIGMCPRGYPGPLSIGQPGAKVEHTTWRTLVDERRPVSAWHSGIFPTASFAPPIWTRGIFCPTWRGFQSGDPLPEPCAIRSGPMDRHGAVCG